MKILMNSEYSTKSEEEQHKSKDNVLTIDKSQRHVSNLQTEQCSKVCCKRYLYIVSKL